MRFAIRTLLLSVLAAGAYASIASTPDFPAAGPMAALVAVPEPLTMSLIGISLIGLGVTKRKRQPE